MVNNFKEFFWILFHPLEGFDQMKYKKSGSSLISLSIIFLWFIVETIKRQFTNFRFNFFDTVNTNVAYIFISTVVLFIFFCIANWSICTLLDGEGTFREIWISSGYALTPFALSTLLSVLFSNFTTINEAAFLNFISTAGFIWSLLLLLFGLMRIHRYNFIMTIFSVLGSLIGLILILFLSFLIIMLFQQMFSFLFSIYQEIFYRL